VALATFPTVEMASHHIDKEVNLFLKQIFCVVGRNSPYNINDFVRILLDAAEHMDFTNNTCVRVGGPSGETVFSRLNGADFEKIKSAFYSTLGRILVLVKRQLRNRQAAFCFDLTDEPYYGKVKGLWIHPQKPAQGSTGCFKYITLSCTDRNVKFILGSLPVRIGADIAGHVTELVNIARQFINPEIVLFDRGFDDYRLVEALQKAGLRYQILWRKHKWSKKAFRMMKRGEMKEVCRIGTYSRNKSKNKVNVRFVIIKSYKRYKNSKAYNWVFCTNTRQRSQHFYVDKYRKRWNIETTFRVLDNIQIKTTTTNEIIRYFINIFCCLMYNLWKISSILDYSITLKNFVVRSLECIKEIISIEQQTPDG
jgi:putative transposase